MFEKVKEILNSLDPNSPISFGRVTREICQLFPKSIDNPNGFEPKADESRLPHTVTDQVFTQKDVDELVAKTASIKEVWYLLEDNKRVKTDRAALMDAIEGKDAECQKRMEEMLAQLHFEPKDVHAFDTSYGYNQVRIDYVFINEDSELWEALKEGIK